MESVVEDVEDQRQTEGSPAKSQSCKSLSGSNVSRHSRGVDQSYGPFSIRGQNDDYVESEAIIKTIINASIYYPFHLPDLKDDHYGVVTHLLHKL